MGKLWLWMLHCHLRQLQVSFLFDFLKIVYRPAALLQMTQTQGRILKQCKNIDFRHCLMGYHRSKSKVQQCPATTVAVLSRTAHVAQFRMKQNMYPIQL